MYTVLKYKLNPNKSQVLQLTELFIDANNIWKNIIENSLTDDKLAKNFKSKYLGSQLKQDLFIEFRNLLKSQRELKKLNKSGMIEYKRKYIISSFSMQPLKILENKIQLQKLGKIQSRGNKSNLKYLNKLISREIISDYKFVAFQLLKRTTGFYIHVIVQLKDYNSSKYFKYSGTSIDLGIKDNIILLDNTKINWEIKESAKLKKLQVKLSKLDKHKEEDKARFLALAFKVRREHELISFKKKHIIDTLINLFKAFELVAIQNELIKLWHEGYFGKQVQHRFYGIIYERLKTLDNVILIDSENPTTKTCSNCGNIKNMTLSDRIYECDHCNLKIDRDLNSAINIFQIATNSKLELNNIPKNKLNLNSKYISIA